jgi:hypothetical protein
MYEQYVHWHSLLVDFAMQIGKPDPEDYVDEGGWKARQGGNGKGIRQCNNGIEQFWVIMSESCLLRKAFN